jgi:hypothetical protein
MMTSICQFKMGRFALLTEFILSNTRCVCVHVWVGYVGARWNFFLSNPDNFDHSRAISHTIPRLVNKRNIGIVGIFVRFCQTKFVYIWATPTIPIWIRSAHYIWSERNVDLYDSGISVRRNCHNSEARGMNFVPLIMELCDTSLVLQDVW